MSVDDKLKEVEEIILGNDIVLFMKGDKYFPHCGFSAAVANLLLEYGIEFYDVNVLECSEIRQAVKDYTSWPTIPQLYVRGKFIGGCDIVVDLHKKGLLAAKLQ